MNKMKNKIQILVVDDEEDIREILSFNLESEGYEVITAESGEEALSKITSQCSLVLLDIMMGGISGLKVADKIRKELKLSVPIVFLTAKTTENDMLTGFSAGGDDYIIKPFSVKEVLARVAAIIRREMRYRQAPEQEMQFAGLKIDPTAKRVYVNNEEILLTKTEYQILVLLVSSPKKTFERQDILDYVWKGDSYVLERTVDVHVARLRKKLGEVGSMIENRSGYGYCFNEN